MGEVPKPLPQRPQQHITKTESTNAFRTILPPEWVSQERVEDYGIDLDVEIFADGHATGLTFLVQVKGQQTTPSKPKLRLRRATWNYWSEQSVPVLVVLWDRERNRFLWQFKHRFDPRETDTTAKLTLNFPATNVWDAETARTIMSEVSAWRAWQSPSAHLPLPCVISASGSVPGISPGKTASALRRLLTPFDSIIRMVTAPQQDLNISIELGLHESAVYISGGGGFHLHHEGLELAAEQVRATLIDSIASDLCLGISAQLFRLNLGRQAALIATAGISRASLIRSPQAGPKILFSLAAEGLVDSAMDVFDRIQAEGTMETRLLATDALMAASTSMGADEIRSVIARMVKLAELCAGNGDPERRAAEYLYNASVFSRRVDLIQASDLLERCANIDVSYRDRGYWWRERAGCLFLCGLHQEAASSYEAALERGEDCVKPLLADALCYLGEYKRAITLWTDFLSGLSDGNPEWILKLASLRYLLDRFGLESQERSPTTATDAVGEDDPALLREILSRDLLCGEALYRLALIEGGDGPPQVDLAIASAIFEPSVAVAWAAAMDAASHDRPGQFENISHAARRFAGDDLVALLLEVVGDDPEQVAAVQGIFDGLPEPEGQGHLVRLTTAGSSEYEAWT